jgi:hypothetical protein
LCFGKSNNWNAEGYSTLTVSLRKLHSTTEV